jgi:VanZ family protein
MSSSPLFFPGYAPAKQDRTGLWLRAWLPALAYTMIFAIESTKYFGSDHTSEPLRRVAEAIFGYDFCTNWEWVHHIIRKTGHFAGYGIFSLVCFRASMMVLGNAARRLSGRLKAYALAVLATFAVACADELHQSFLPNRTGCFSDVLLDTLGAVVFGLFLFLALLMTDWWKQARMRARMRPGNQNRGNQNRNRASESHPALV